MKLEFSRQIFGQFSSIKFNENPSSGSRAILFVRTDRRDGANIRVSQFFERALKLHFSAHYIFYPIILGFGGLGVACWPLVPKFAGSNPAEAV